MYAIYIERYDGTQQLRQTLYHEPNGTVKLSLHLKPLENHAYSQLNPEEYEKIQIVELVTKKVIK